MKIVKITALNKTNSATQAADRKLAEQYLSTPTKELSAQIMKMLQQTSLTNQIPLACVYQVCCDSGLPPNERTDLFCNLFRQYPTLQADILETITSTNEMPITKLSATASLRNATTKNELKNKLENGSLGENLFFLSPIFATHIITTQNGYFEQHKDELILILTNKGNPKALRGFCSAQYTPLVAQLVRILSYQNIVDLFTTIITHNKLSIEREQIDFGFLIHAITQAQAEQNSLDNKYHPTPRENVITKTSNTRVTADGKAIQPHHQANTLTRMIDNAENVPPNVVAALQKYIYENLASTSYIPRRNIDYSALHEFLTHTDLIKRPQTTSVLVSMFGNSDDEERNLIKLIQYDNGRLTSKLVQLFSKSPTLFEILLSEIERNIVSKEKIEPLVENIFNTMKFDQLSSITKYIRAICTTPKRICKTLAYRSLLTIMQRNIGTEQLNAEKLQQLLANEFCTPELIHTHARFFASVLKQLTEKSIKLPSTTLQKFINNDVIIPRCANQFRQAVTLSDAKIELFYNCSTNFVTANMHLFMPLFTSKTYRDFRAALLVTDFTATTLSKISRFLADTTVIACMSTDNPSLLYDASCHNPVDVITAITLLQTAINNNQCQQLSSQLLEQIFKLNNGTIYTLAFSNSAILQRICTLTRNNSNLPNTISPFDGTILITEINQNTIQDFFTNEQFAPLLECVGIAIHSSLQSQEQSSYAPIRTLFKISNEKHEQLFHDLNAIEFANLVDLEDDTLSEAIFCCATVAVQLNVYITNNISAIAQHPKTISRILASETLRLALVNISEEDLVQLLKLNDRNLTANLWKFNTSVRLERVINNASICTEIFTCNDYFAEQLTSTYNQHRKAIDELQLTTDLLKKRKTELIRLLSTHEKYRQSLTNEHLKQYLDLNDNELLDTITDHYQDFSTALLQLANNSNTTISTNERLLTAMLRHNFRSLSPAFYVKLLGLNLPSVQTTIQLTLLSAPELLLPILRDITNISRATKTLETNITILLQTKTLKPSTISKDDIQMLCKLTHNSGNIHSAFTAACQHNFAWIISLIEDNKIEEHAAKFCEGFLRSTTSIPSDTELTRAVNSSPPRFLAAIFSNPIYYNILCDLNDLALNKLQITELIKTIVANNNSDLLELLYHKKTFNSAADTINNLCNDDANLPLLNALFKIEATSKPDIAEDSVFANVTNDNWYKLYRYDQTITNIILCDNYHLFSSHITENFVRCNIDSLVENIESMMLILSNPYICKYFHMYMQPKHLSQLLKHDNDALTRLVIGHVLIPVTGASAAEQSAQEEFPTYAEAANIVSSLKQIYSTEDSKEAAKRTKNFITYQQMSVTDNDELTIKLSPTLIHPNLLYHKEMRTLFEFFADRVPNSILSYVGKLEYELLLPSVTTFIAKLKAQLVVNHLAETTKSLDQFNALLNEVIISHQTQLKDAMRNFMREYPENINTLKDNINKSGNIGLTKLFDTLTEAESQLTSEEVRSDTFENTIEDFSPPPPPPQDRSIPSLTGDAPPPPPSQNESIPSLRGDAPPPPLPQEKAPSTPARILEALKPPQPSKTPMLHAITIKAAEITARRNNGQNAEKPTTPQTKPPKSGLEANLFNAVTSRREKMNPDADIDSRDSDWSLTSA